MLLALVAGTIVGNIPSWSAYTPEPQQPLGGFIQVPGTKLTELCHGTVGSIGTYNHAAMIDYHNGIFFAAWKNGPWAEDKSGQRILYTQSKDGVVWTTVAGAETNILFPNMTTTARDAAVFVGPPIKINGRQYVGASPGEPTGAADGAQFCLWPDPLEVNGRNHTRNCGPPANGHHYKQFSNTLLMREVKAGIGNLGPIFWADQSNEVPSDWEAASKALGFLTLDKMDAQTQSDIAQLNAAAQTGMGELPCSPPASGSLKCEACLGGCQLFDAIPYESQPNVSLERAHYTVPNSTADVILYRGSTGGFVWAATRSNMSAGQDVWQGPVATNIPNDESNLNAGALPDGRVYLVNNAVFRPKKASSSGDNTLRFRDPVTVATTSDGYVFDKAAAVMSCTNLSATSTCAPRHTESPKSSGGKNPGPSYPQGITIVEPAPPHHRGLYVVATNNKEDVWLAKLDFGSF